MYDTCTYNLTFCAVLALRGLFAQVTLNGSDDGVAFAMDQLLKLDKDPESVLSVQHVSVKRSYHRFLLCKHGIHSRLLRVNLGVRIVLPDSADSNQELIYIFGRKKETQDVKKKIESIVASFLKQGRRSVPVPSDLANRFTENRGKVRVL